MNNNEEMNDKKKIHSKEDILKIKEYLAIGFKDHIIAYTYLAILILTLILLIIFNIFYFFNIFDSLIFIGIIDGILAFLSLFFFIYFLILYLPNKEEIIYFKDDSLKIIKFNKEIIIKLKDIKDISFNLYFASNAGNIYLYLIDNKKIKIRAISDAKYLVDDLIDILTYYNDFSSLTD